MRNLTGALSFMAVMMFTFSAGCGSDASQDEPKVDTTQAEPDTTADKTQTGEVEAEGEMVTTESGLRYIDLKVGEGVKAENGMNVDVHYTLWLDKDGEKGNKIDSSRDRDQPFPFQVGMQGLIAGWNEGMLGMQVGGIRRLYIPYQLGYGEAGRPPMLPGKSDLLFEIELLQIK